MAKRLARVQKDICAACGSCVKVCPRNAISIYKGAYALVDESKYIGCSLCAKECPASIITIKSKELVA